MVDLAILRAFGSTNERLKEVLTAVPNEAFKKVPKGGESKEDKKARLAKARQNDADVSARSRMEVQDRRRIEQGILFSLQQWKLYASVDIAWDSAPITKAMIPLLMYAQGKVEITKAAKLLKGTSAEGCIKCDDSGKPTQIDIPKFVETHVNLIRSVISRRHAAQKNKYNGLFPYYKYEPRSTGMVGKVRADVLSQRVEILVDQFGIRHHDAQVMRDGMLYGHVVDFPTRPWEVVEQWRMKDKDGDPSNVEAVVVKEGMSWFNPHPSRVFYDTAHPLAALNHDCGPRWVGFWDVMRYSEIEDNPDYYNKYQLGFNRVFWGSVYPAYADYFNHYTYTITPPGNAEEDPARENDRKSSQSLYNGSYRDASVFVSHYYEKITPSHYNIGKYPYPVWVHKVVAANGITVFAEFLPSTPCAVLSINESDGRLTNVSMAMELMGYQDQMTNLLTQLLMVCQIESFKAIGINTDLLEPDQVEHIRKALEGSNWSGDPLVYSYSLKKLEQLGLKVDGVISLSRPQQGQTIATLLDAMMKLVALVERMMALSPNEQGQPAPREISATEVAAIGTTTTTVYSSISGDIDEFRAAKKRIIYESLICCGKSNLNVPIKERYTAATVKQAGFEPVESEDFQGGAKRHTVIGTTKAMVHDYVFSSRDGDERPINTQAANTLVQLVSQVLAMPSIAQAMGKEKIYEIFNEIFRLSGAGVDLNLQLKEGEDNSLGMDEMAQLQETIKQIQGYMQQMAEQINQSAQSIQNQEQINEQQERAIQAMNQLAVQVNKVATDLKKMKDEGDNTRIRIIESMNYKDCPPDIRRQIEQAVGFTPSTAHEVSPSAPKPTPKK